ncbi:MAG: Mrp/NBP35 family ATP-binding protein [Kiritimatiellae bacterium]|nr:Mrp/NBP35 family ATP-binding protein [Kiritimatiellia bacterium]
MSECTHDCSTCGNACASKAPADFAAPLNANSKIRRVIAVASGKGGVGKSLVATMLAVTAMRKGLKVGILDADITGPSIPKAFGIVGGTFQTEFGIEPARSTGGIRIISLNMLIEHPDEPVVWRGSMIAGCVKQFWSEVHWGELDLLVIDMPPGTGDVPLTVFQSIPVDGVVVVSSPQELVEMIVGKSVRMCEMMNKPVLGLVENMSYFQCPKCGEIHELYGESKALALAGHFKIPRHARLPVDPEIARLVDGGAAENVELPADATACREAIIV